MNLTDNQNILNQVLSVPNHTYTGARDPDYFRCGEGIETWSKGGGQRYCGQFLNDCLHGTGTYTWNIDRKKYVYEGKFYANNIDGYGVFSYPDGKVHEGLFKNNSRFGPGIQTYPDGTQDVGLWRGLTLIRLSRTVISQEVPMLTETVNGKAYLLQYRSLINVNCKTKIEEMLNSSEITNKLIENSHLYSKYDRNPNSLLFNKRLFDDNYSYNDSDYTVETVENIEGNLVKKNIIVSDLLAWNNEEIYISIMKHTFMNRNFEKIISYSVEEILSGQSKKFRDIGLHEQVCLDFLKSCCTDNESLVKNLICDHDLHPDVSDNLGNSGITIAASYNNLKIIKTLINFGSNIDHLNDECLTPLLICLLKYIGLKYNVQYWEQAFLPKTTSKLYEDNIQEWRNRVLENSKDFNGNLKPQSYLFDLSCVHPPKRPKAKKEKPKKKDKKNAKAVETKVNTAIKIDPKVPELQIISKTIVTLLCCGTDANFGEVPFPPLILSLFSKTPPFLLHLIKFGADCNIIMNTPERLTPLHIICSMQPCKELIQMAEILLKNGAKLDNRAGQNHWCEEKAILLSNFETEDLGKTPLHLLAMRWDYEYDTDDIFGSIFTTFLKFNVDLDLLYLGHTSLSLAIVRGNINLINKMLNSCKVNPNETLGNNMGLPLTVLVLKRYANILPINDSKNIFDTLISFHANPFNSVPNFETNAVEFTLEENRPEEGKNKEKIKGDHSKLLQHFTVCVANTLLKHIQGKVVKFLYIYKFQNNLEHELYDCIVKFIDIYETLSILQILIAYKAIYPDKDLFHELLEYVNDESTSQKSKKKRISPSDLLEKLELKQSAKICFDNYPPEVDSTEKYRVCFNCYQKTNKELICCPKCNLVYFCSEACNKLNNKKKSRHPCKILFYSSELERLKELRDRGIKVEEFDNLGKTPVKKTTDIVAKKKETKKGQSEESSDEDDDKSKHKRKKEKQKKGSQEDASSFDDTDKSKRKKGKKQKDSDEGESLDEKGKSKSKTKKGKQKKGSQEDEGSLDVKDKSKRKKGKKQKGSDEAESSDEKSKSKSKTKKGKLKSSEDETPQRRGRSTTPKGSVDKVDSKKARKEKSKTTKDAIEKPEKEHKDKPEKSRKGKSAKGKSSEELATRKDHKDKSRSRKEYKDETTSRKDKSKSRKRSKDEAVRAGKHVRHAVSVDRRKKDLERPGKHARYTKSDTHLYDKRYKSQLRLRDKVAPDDYMEFISQGFKTDDIFKFTEKFLPYCVLVDGQLYYKFDSQNVFYKFTYSSV